VALLAMVGLVLGFVSPVFATTYYGPSFTISPSSIAPGETVNILLSTTSGSSFSSPPGGGSNGPTGTCSGTEGNCYFTLESCPSGEFDFYSIHQITVTDPDGNNYYLGGSSGYSLSWPVSLGGPESGGVSTQTTAEGFGPALNVSQSDSFSIPFGQGVGGFSFTSSLGTNPSLGQVEPEGPYYWYAIHSSTPLPPSFNPTTVQGTYSVDIEGAVVCGPISAETVTPFTIAPIFFDGAVTFNTPQFAAGSAVAVAIGLVGLAFLRRKSHAADEIPPI